MTDLERTRRHLREIPELHAQVGLYLLPGSLPPDPDARTSTGSKSRPPVVLDVVDLLDDRKKSGWLGWEPGDDTSSDGRRHSVAVTLSLWVMMAESDMDDLGRTFTPCDCETILETVTWLTHHLEFILDIHPIFERSITRIHADLRRACGVRPEPAYRCLACGNRAFLDGHWMVCTEGHEESVENLEQRQRRRPPQATDDVCAEFGVTRDRLYQWHRRGKITPARTEGRKLFWWPWDVLCVVNPAIAHAYDTRDSGQADAG